MQLHEAGAPFEILGLDYMGPFPRTARKNTAILTMVDYFSRLTVLVPVKAMTAEVTANSLMTNWVSYYGIPRNIHSDQGTHFENRIMYALCAKLGARKTRTTSYRPQADGRVERMNRNVKECLTRLLHENPESWDQLLPHVSMAINSTVNE